MPISPELLTHLSTGATTLCRAWALTRRDGVVLGFTDHDCDLEFEGIVFGADSGLTAKALQQTTGLSVDNTEAMGVLSSESISDADIAAGRFDGAEVRAWLVNWSAPEQRVLQFRGTVGEIVRKAGAFQAELRGLTESLNQPQGRVYQKPCTAVLGDSKCRFALDRPGFSVEVPAGVVEGGRIFRFAGLDGFADRWFDRGALRVVDGQAAGLRALIKNDIREGASRRVELWEAIGLPVGPGDIVRLEAGCDKRAETCRVKFDNFANFRGFPHVPGEDWLMSYPVTAGKNDGGSLSQARNKLP
jgi:uncharacterized phage protein (TIGR02218 family)